MNEYVGKLCPYCKAEIKDGDEVTVCPECGIPHHADCWKENGGCTTFGCKAQHYKERHTAPADVCANCGTPLREGQIFCPKCGHKTEIVVDAGKEAAPSPCDTSKEAASPCDAGAEKKPKSKKSLVLIAIILVFCIGLAVALLGIKAVKEQSAYKEAAAGLYASISSAVDLLEDVGSDGVSDWYSEVYNDIYCHDNDGVRRVKMQAYIVNFTIAHSDSISAISDAYDEIAGIYENMASSAGGTESEFEPLKDAVESVYAAYTEFYEIVVGDGYYTIVMREGSKYSSYPDAFHETDSTLSSALKELGDLIS